MTIRETGALRDDPQGGRLVVKFRAGDDGRGFRLGAPVSVLAMHQLSRWVVAKEDHCGRTTTLVATWPSYSCQRMMPEAFAISRRRIRGRAHDPPCRAVGGDEGDAERGRVAACAALEHAVSDMCPMYLPAYEEDGEEVGHTHTYTDRVL